MLWTWNRLLDYLNFRFCLFWICNSKIYSKKKTWVIPNQYKEHDECLISYSSVMYYSFQTNLWVPLCPVYQGNCYSMSLQVLTIFEKICTDIYRNVLVKLNFTGRNNILFYGNCSLCITYLSCSTNLIW